MNMWIKKYCFFILATSVIFLSSCVTETESGGGFKKPTKEDLERAISLYVQIAQRHLESKDYEKAMANVKQALDIDKNSPLALNELAIVYQYQGDTDKAKKTFQKVLSQDGKFSEGHLSYGQFLFQQKEFDQACKQFQIAAEDDFYPKRATAFFNLSVCLNASGNAAGAEAALGRCLGLDPNNTSALGQLASIKFDQGQYAESKSLLDRHIQLIRDSGQKLSAEALWLAIRLERKFGNQDAEASWVLFLKNNYPYSKEYLQYQDSLKK